MKKIEVSLAIAYLNILQADGVKTVPVAPVDTDGSVYFDFYHLPDDCPWPSQAIIIPLPDKRRQRGKRKA